MIRTNRFPILPAAAAVTAFGLLIGAGAARAGVSKLSVQFEHTPPPIEVTSDGHHFTLAKPRQMTYALAVHAGCDGGQSLGLFVAAPHPNEAWVFKWASHAAETNRGIVLLDVPLDKLFRAPFNRNPVQLCNDMLEDRVAKGAVRSQVIASGFSLPYVHTVGAAAKCWSDDGDVAEAGPTPSVPSIDDQRGWKSAEDQRIGVIYCQGHNVLVAPGLPSPPTPVGGVAVPFQVQKATLSTFPTQQTAHCPVTLTFTGSIGVVGKGTVKYRLNHNGERGPVQTLSFPGTEAQGVSFHVEIKPTPVDLDPAPASNPGIGNLAGNPVPQNQHNGFARIEIVSPSAGVDHSQDAVYQVNCLNPGGQVAPGGLASPHRSAEEPHARSHKPKEIVVVGSKIHAPLQPDLTSQHGINLGGHPSPWGGTIALSAAEAISTSGGACVYRYDYDAENVGTVPGGPFASRLHDGAAFLAENKDLSLAAGATQHVGGHLRLKPGSHVVRVFLDEAKQVTESDEANNQRRVRVVVKGDCGPRSR